MTIIRTWSGDNAPLGDLGTSTTGDGDHPFNHRVGTMTVTADGPRPNAISIPNASAVTRCGWAEVPGHPLTQWCVRMYVTMTDHPGTEAAILQANDTGVQSWRVTWNGSGILRLRVGEANTIVWTGTIPMPTGQPVRLEAIQADGTLTIAAYAGDTMTILDTGGGASTGTLEAMWFGITAAAATTGMLIDDMALSNEAELIGPAAEPPPSYPPRHRYNGTTWIPLGNTHLIEE